MRSMEGEAEANAGPALNTEHLQLSLLQYQQDIVEELLNQDGLAIMGAGLGMCTIVAGLLAVHQATGDSGGVTIIIGAVPTMLPVPRQAQQAHHAQSSAEKHLSAEPNDVALQQSCSPDVGDRGY